MFSSSCNNVSSLFPQFCNPNNDTMNNGNDYNNHNSMLVFDSSSSSSNQIPLTVSFWPTNGYNCEVPILNDTQQHHHHQQQQPQANQNALNENENALPVFRQPKGPVKRKDRHSKISTAQGVRDRRVRLSIEIARKFFDLQDLLGFDRASKTLEWLLLKSKKAIKELSTHSNNEDDNNTNKKQSLCSSNSSCDQADQDHLVVSNNKLDSKREKKLEKIPLVAKQSRAKARARARERTKMKMSIRALHDQFIKTCSVPTLIPILNHSRSADLKVQMEENGANTSCYNHHQVMEQQQQHTTTTTSEQQQSLEMKKKLKSHLMIGYHQNLVSSSQPQNLSQNWEITNQISRSSFWTITNMNLSSGPQVQVNGRSWKDL